MALTVSLGPDSVRHTCFASASPAGPPSCCGSGGGRSTGFIASPSPVLLAALPRLLKRRGRNFLAPSGESFADSCAGRSVNCSKSCSTSRRVHCGAAEWKTLRTADVNENDLEHESVFRPPLGWPVSAAAPDVQLLEKAMSTNVALPDSPVILDQLHPEVACSKVFAGSDERQSENLYRHWIATEFSAAVQSGSPPPRQTQESEERDNYYLNTGYAIRTLREELPHLFYRKLSFDIYRNDITFRDPMNSFSGIDNYKLIFWALRFHGRIFFKSIWVEILRVWQPHDKVIMVRWTVRGVPRVPWEAQGHFDGTSEYKLDKNGKIYEHKVDNVIFNSPPTQKFKAISVLDLVRVKGRQTTPTPSFFAQTAILFDILFPYLRQFTWIRFYWALKSTLALNNAGECCCNA